MSEAKLIEVKDGKILAGVDTNKDGEQSLSAVVKIDEAIQEAIARGEAIEGNKVVSVKFELTKLKIVVDSDKDGESLLELTVDLAEVYDEIANPAK